MPLRSLDEVPDGSDIFIDANIFVYGLTGVSLQCRRFLERCMRQSVTDLCLFEIVNEATHHFMLAEARGKGLIKPGAGWKELHADIVLRLRDYWRNTQRVLGLNVLFAETDERIIASAQPVREEAGLLTNDSMIVAFMRQYGVRCLASSDRAFQRVSGITVFYPGDLPGTPN